ncbi:MAG: 23S rRNA (guanosine(2251)-2'-O)-methyltransferase RlmB [Holosporaceae bacterium]|jgi:23S rRNA (guanosine2251-2'-O)-methyltransferase|nr:23S rRNA (guanosine(2251)-2'-O)-methyltransferase RlmB [Holosporaceae bacterium]
MSTKIHAHSRSDKNRNSFWIYGKHAVKAAILNKERKILRLILLESCKDFLEEYGSVHESLQAELVDKNYFAAKFGKDATHQGCAVLVKDLHFHLCLEDLLTDESDNRPFMFLDQITDPQNLGSILRASAVFGARAVVVPEHNSPEFSPAIWKAASGAAEYVPIIRVINFVHAINDLKKHGFWCVGLDEKSSKTMSEMDLERKLIVVIGSEGTGMRRLTRESCDFLVKLPGIGSFTTLNAAQAATISLYEIRRQCTSHCFATG